MEKYRTKFGTWISVFCARHGLNIARAAYELGLAPTTLASIVAGRHPLPVFLRENIIATFGRYLSGTDIAEMDQSIVDTEAGAVIVSRNYKKYVSAQTVNDKEWCLKLMDVMAKATNKMNKEESEEIYARLQEIAERPAPVSIELDKDIDIETLRQDIRRRYKDPVKTEQIVEKIKELRQ
ncbi:MAG: hypothetical protein J6T27_03060 [Alphaproteobacteria bacterium]|nr:hypothetical protein [Alphaproteobacteria bacterium]